MDVTSSNFADRCMQIHMIVVICFYLGLCSCVIAAVVEKHIASQPEIVRDSSSGNTG